MLQRQAKTNRQPPYRLYLSDSITSQITSTNRVKLFRINAKDLDE